jgi:tetratricopeptide (TPR) repeat protein
MKQRFVVYFAFAFTILSFNQCISEPDKTTGDKHENKTVDLSEQLEELNRKISSDPGNPEYYNDRAVLYLDNDEFTEAFKDVTKAIELDSTKAEYYLTQSDVYLAMGKIQGSVEALENALHLDDKNALTHVMLAEISIVFLDYQKALRHIEQAIAIDELVPQAYFLRGVVFLEQADTIRAIRNFQQAIVVDQDFFDAHVQLGTLYAKAQNKLAVDYFNNALNIEPGNQDVLYNLAMFYQETGDYDKAIANYNIMIESDPDSFIAYFNLGFIHLVYLEDYASAIEFFTDAINKRNDYAEAYYNRGLAYELMLNVEASQNNYRKSLEYNPNYEKAIDGLNRIDEFLIEKNR